MMGVAQWAEDEWLDKAAGADVAKVCGLRLERNTL